MRLADFYMCSRQRIHLNIHMRQSGPWCDSTGSEAYDRSIQRNHRLLLPPQTKYCEVNRPRRSQSLVVYCPQHFDPSVCMYNPTSAKGRTTEACTLEQEATMAVVTILRSVVLVTIYMYPRRAWTRKLDCALRS